MKKEFRIHYQTTSLNRNVVALTPVLHMTLQTKLNNYTQDLFSLHQFYATINNFDYAFFHPVYYQGLLNLLTPSSPLIGLSNCY